MTDSVIPWPDGPSQAQAISGNRRSDRRYDLRLDVKWKLIRRRKVLDSGIGRTIDLSSGGILFNAGRDLPLGFNVELSIAWPIRLHDVAPLQLVVSGKIVRTAVRMIQHEFRTASLPPEHRGVLAGVARTPTPFFSNLTNVAGLGRYQ